MTLRDKDLVSIQEARALVERALEAQRKFAEFPQEQVDAVVEACARAALEAAEPLARMAVEETGYGNVADKVIKNTLAADHVWRAIRGIKTAGILRHDKEKGIVEVASPVGVVAAIIPTTNPTSTAIYKTLISIKARNGIVCSPHPNATRCICETLSILARAAERAGAPAGLIACMREATMPGTQELMRLREVGVILATGGAGLVRQAYSSGRPAYGVGPGNVPAYIERSANVRKAVADIIAGKTFDYGTICSSEQAIVCDEAVRDLVLEECRRNQAHFLTPEEMQKVGAMLFDPVRHVPNAKVVGQPATKLAAMAAIKVSPHTRVLIARMEPQQVGREFPLSAEKLSPILALYVVNNAKEGMELCRRLLLFGGAGHTAAVHTQNEAVAREFGAAVPAFRVCVNTSAVHGSIGYSTNLFPAMTLGCGSPGGNITSDNIGPQHLMNVKRIAWESRPVEHRTIPEAQRLSGTVPVTQTAPPAQAAKAPAMVAVAAAVGSGGAGCGTVAPVPAADPAGLKAGATDAAPDRALIANIVERVFSSRGIARAGSTGVQPVAPREAAPAHSAQPQEDAHEREEATSASSDAGLKASATETVPSPARTSESPKTEVVPFVSENDVRVAITRGQKIFVGPRTIITPSARDLASDHEGVLIETR
jgi:acetaldehyde dehydrogenase (acetylating)